MTQSKRWLRTAALAATLIAAAGLAACGESAEAKAEKAICKAHEELSTGAEALRSLTLATVTSEAVKADVAKLEHGLATIRAEVPKLAEARRGPIEAADAKFREETANLLAAVGKTKSLEESAPILQSDIAQLAEVYRHALEPIHCK